MYALEDLCAKLDSTRDRVAAMSLSIAIACNPHLTLVLYRKYEPHLREYTNRILENSYAVMDFIRAKVIHPRLFKRSSISAAWIDPQYVIENKDLFHKHVVDSMKLVNVNVLRAFDLRPRDMLLKFYAANGADEHMRVVDTSQPFNHRVYLPCVIASWAFLCALTAAATTDDINALYLRAPLYDENNNECGKMTLAATRGRSFMCPVCAAACPDAPLDAAEEHGLYRYKTFWKHNRQLTCAFIAVHAEHVNWAMLSANPAVWAAGRGSDDSANTILSVYHEQLEPAVVVAHAPMRLLQIYYGDVPFARNMRENPTCPRKLVEERLFGSDWNIFAQIALPRVELEQLF